MLQTDRQTTDGRTTT